MVPDEKSGQGHTTTFVVEETTLTDSIVSHLLR